MTAKSHKRGHEIIYNGDQWQYSDTGEPAEEERPCKRCGRMPTPEGHDACLGKLPGVGAACCGHGVDDAYAIDNNPKLKAEEGESNSRGEGW